jgi:hypothetical protein
LGNADAWASFAPLQLHCQNLPQGNKYMMYFCAIGGNQGGGLINCNIGRSVLLPLGALGLAVGLCDETGGNTA